MRIRVLLAAALLGVGFSVAPVNAAVSPYAGVYFGDILLSPSTPEPKKGRFALLVHENGTAEFLAYQWLPAFLGDLPAGGFYTHLSVFESGTLVVNDDGAAESVASRYGPASAFTGGVGPRPPGTGLRVSPADLRFKIDVAGNVEGMLTAAPFRGVRRSGGAATLPGGAYYRGGAMGSALEFRAIAASDGHFLAVLVNANGADPIVSNGAIVEPPLPGSGPASFLVDAGEGDISGSAFALRTEYGRELAGTLPQVTLRSTTEQVPFGVYHVGTSPELRARFVNASGRASVGGQRGASTLGFVMGGSTPRTVLVRAAGQALQRFGVASGLASLRLRLHGSAGPLAENAKWGSAANADEIQSIAAQAGAFPFDLGSSDAAILLTLPPGAYTATTQSATSEDGVVLTEAYDVSTPSAPQRLANASILGFAEANHTPLILGLVVDGPVGSRVLVRAVGPSLAAYGVAAPLAQPKLTLRDAKGRELTAPIDATTTVGKRLVAEAQQANSAFALPESSREPAMLLWLSPGAYTAEVTSAGASGGVVLIEAYDAL